MRKNKWKISQKKTLLLTCLLCLFVLCAAYSQPQGQAIFRVNEHNIKTSSDVKVAWLLPVYVSRVVDGDTIVVEIENPPAGFSRRERVRFLGVDAPETVRSSRPIEHFGRESSDMAKATLQERQVYLAFDWNLRDRFGRLLAYIYLEDGVCFNAMQLKYGYTRVYVRFPFQFLEEFRQYEAEARAKKLGLWE